MHFIRSLGKKDPLMFQTVRDQMVIMKGQWIRRCSKILRVDCKEHSLGPFILDHLRFNATFLGRTSQVIFQNKSLSLTCILIFYKFFRSC